jgi:hypothetical protein
MNADMAYQIVRRANAALDAQQTADAVTLMTAGGYDVAKAVAAVTKPKRRVTWRKPEAQADAQ